MAYNEEELLSLPAKEKFALAEDLWSSVEEEFINTTDDEISFAEERLKMHEANPTDGVSVDVFKKYFSEKYGF